jgi:hypothetical protein
MIALSEALVWTDVTCPNAMEKSPKSRWCQRISAREEAETLFSIIMNINSPISQSEMDSINFSLGNEGELPSEK